MSRYQVTELFVDESTMQKITKIQITSPREETFSNYSCAVIRGINARPYFRGPGPDVVTRPFCGSETGEDYLTILGQQGIRGIYKLFLRGGPSSQWS